MTSTQDEADKAAQEHFTIKVMNEHERNFFFIREEFVPNLKAEGLTLKFYARHDTLEEEPNPEYIKAIDEVSVSCPKERNDEPETENQRYGWDITPLVPIDLKDKLMNHRHNSTPLTTVEAEIYMATKNTPKEPPFTGVPFKL